MRMDLTRFRPFISVCVLLTFVVLAISGLVLFLHLRTLGSLAVWKHTHIWISFAFLLGALIHLALNWKALARHFTDSARSRQWLLAAAFCAVLLALVIAAGGREEARRGPFRQNRGKMESGQRHPAGPGQAVAAPRRAPLAAGAHP